MESPTLFSRGNTQVVMAAALLTLGGGVAGQTATDAPGDQKTAERCSDAVHREFDFWLGTWEVRNEEGELLGHNEIERVAGGCALLESWHSAGGGDGMSINTYDSRLGKWTQRWVGVGATLWLEGGIEDGRMVLAGTSPRSTSRGEVLDRITWTPLPDGRVRQVWEVSADGGKSWRADFVGYYSAAGAS